MSEVKRAMGDIARAFAGVCLAGLAVAVLLMSLFHDDKGESFTMGVAGLVLLVLANQYHSPRGGGR